MDLVAESRGIGNIFNIGETMRIFLFLMLTPSLSYGYIDPGSGLLLWQGLIAAIGAIIVFVRHPIEMLKHVWNKLLGRK